MSEYATCRPEDRYTGEIISSEDALFELDERTIDTPPQDAQRYEAAEKALDPVKAERDADLGVATFFGAVALQQGAYPETNRSVVKKSRRGNTNVRRSSQRTRDEVRNDENWPVASRSVQDEEVQKDVRQLRLESMWQQVKRERGDDKNAAKALFRARTKEWASEDEANHFLESH